MTRQTTTHIAIGNSDDRLGQRVWHEFVKATDRTVREHAAQVYGFWTSPSDAPFQNASWAFHLATPADRDRLRRLLSYIAGSFDQDSIAWNESATEFLRPDNATEPLFEIEIDRIPTA